MRTKTQLKQPFGKSNTPRTNQRQPFKVEPRISTRVLTANQIDRPGGFKTIKQVTFFLEHFVTPFAPILLLLVVGLLPYFLLPEGKSRWGDFLNIFLGLTIEALPFLLMGALVAATLGVWKQRNKRVTGVWKKIVGTRGGATAAGIGLGFALPVCECGTASIARQVTREGAPVSMSLVFLLAAPIINPVTILATWIAFGGDWSIVLGRVGLGLVLATGMGLLFSFHPAPGQLFKPGLMPGGKDNLPVNNPPASPHAHSHSAPTQAEEKQEVHAAPVADAAASQPGRSKVSGFMQQCFLEFLGATKVAVPGISLAAAFQAYISPGLFLGLGQGAVLSVAILMLLATLMSVCSSVDAFVALSFTGLFPVGAVLAFLVFGPLINLKSLFLFRLVLRPATIWLLTVLCFSFILLAGVIINLRLV
ncbi:MAG: permease [Chloroflexi bacterium]|nr:permease [Chloroflexota bacterium]OJV93012.1 MAG: hypothetical protein BGO39_21095 [Chloroflexi bacterium 54-19]